MENFRTEIHIEDSNNKIEYNDPTLFIGSCFADNIGGKFTQCRLPSMINPFGVMYNPISVANTLSSIIHKKEYTESDLRFHNDLWLSFEHHGSFSDPNKEQCLQKINTSCNNAHIQLKKSKYLFITFGTAWVYQLNETSQIVSNCHKYAAKLFNRYMLNMDEIVDLYKSALTELLVFNPEVKIVFTVSPVRHWKDGAHGNMLSKATLLMAIDKICEMFESCSYFPAYEILMDDLRDYRFYSSDMIHPNSTAIDYVWSKFENCFFSTRTLEYKKEMTNLEKALNHKPFNSKTESHQKFLKNQYEKLKHLINKYPEINFSKDLAFLSTEII